MHMHSIGQTITSNLGHSPRRYIEAMARDHVLVKVDFTNAFNAIHREDMLYSVYNRIPELYAFCKSAYGQASILHFGGYTVLSQEGAQKGDRSARCYSATLYTRRCHLCKPN